MSPIMMEVIEWFDQTGTGIVQRCLSEGVVILKAGTYDNVIRLLPPLTIEEGLLDYLRAAGRRRPARADGDQLTLL